MADRELDDLVAILPPLLGALEALGFVQRHMIPEQYHSVMQAAGAPDAVLREALPRLDDWPERLAELSGRLKAASGAVFAAFDGLRDAPQQADGMRSIFRALGHLPRAQEALYPLAADLPPVSRFFLDPAMRGDAALQASVAGGRPRADTGVMHFDNEPGSRGGYSVYAPEYYDEGRAWPLVMALHGGAGSGRSFLWSWLRDARAHGAIVIAPTAVGPTWALSGRDPDTPNLAAILDEARLRWNLDPERLLLTGMSDGGTFCYVSGLEAGSPFTHLAPCSASFHPVIAQMADKERITGLPIHLTHGALDWMFSIDVAREANEALTAAGARVTYREIDDLSHTYPREVNPDVLRWLDVTEGAASGG